VEYGGLRMVLGGSGCPWARFVQRFVQQFGEPMSGRLVFALPSLSPLILLARLLTCLAHRTVADPVFRSHSSRVMQQDWDSLLSSLASCTVCAAFCRSQSTRLTDATGCTCEWIRHPLYQGIRQHDRGCQLRTSLQSLARRRNLHVEQSAWIPLFAGDLIGGISKVHRLGCVNLCSIWIHRRSLDECRKESIKRLDVHRRAALAPPFRQKI